MQKYLQVVKGVVLSRDAQILLWCTGVVAIWRVSLELINHAIVPTMNTLSGSAPTQVFSLSFDRWINYDAGWYLNIIKNGYTIIHHLHGQETIAFFPVYPVTVRVLSDILHIPVVWTGIILNLILLVVTAYFVYKLTILMAEQAKRKDGEVVAKFAVILFILNPASFYFASLYADVILVLCMTAAVYFGLKGSFYTAALFAGIAAGAKSIGIVLLPVLLIMYIQANWKDIKNGRVVAKTHIPRLVAIGLLGSSGILAYMAYLWHRFGNPLEFVSVEKYWGRSPSLMAAAHSIWNQYIGILHTHDRLINYNLYGIYLGVIPIGLAILTLYILVKHRWQYLWLVVLTALVVIMPLSTGQLASLNRYVLGLTPVIAYVAIYVYTNKCLRPISLALVWLSVVLLFIFSSSFLAGYFMG